MLRKCDICKNKYFGFTKKICKVCNEIFDKKPMSVLDKEEYAFLLGMSYVFCTFKKVNGKQIAIWDFETEDKDFIESFIKPKQKFRVLNRPRGKVGFICYDSKLVEKLFDDSCFSIGFSEKNENDKNVIYSYIFGVMVSSSELGELDSEITFKYAMPFPISELLEAKFIDLGNNGLMFKKDNYLDLLYLFRQNISFFEKSKFNVLYDLVRVSDPIWNNEQGGRYFYFSKLHPEAVAPKKSRASDSGYDVVLIEKVKTVGDVEFYSTGINVEPAFGYYLDMVPRSSFSKSGYELANSIGIIDRSYRGPLIAGIRKVDKNAPDIELPARWFQVIPRRIDHVEWVELDSLDETERGSGGFGSTGK